MRDVLIYERRTGNIEAIGFNNASKRVFEIDRGAVTISFEENIQLRREFFSSTPLFFTFTSDFFLASTSCVKVVELLTSYIKSPSLNIEYIHDYIKFQCPFTNDTIYNDIYHLRGGEIATISENGIVTKNFDSKFVFSHSASTFASCNIVDTFYEILSNDVFDNAVFHISSGLDSSLLAMLAKRVKKQRKVRVATCKTLGRGATEELDIVKRLSDEYGFDLTIYSFDDIDIFKEGKNLSFNASFFPIAHPSHLTRYLLDRSISRSGCSVVVTGRGSDEWLAGYDWHSPVFRTQNTHSSRICASNDELLQGLFVPDVYQLLTNRSMQCYCSFMSSNILTLNKILMYDRWSIGEAWDILDNVFADALGITYQNPFCSPQLGSMLMGLPHDVKYRNDKGKWWLRETFKDIYPGYILDQPKRGLTFDINQYFMHYYQEEIFQNIFERFEFNQKIFCKNSILSLIKMTRTKEKLFGWQLWSIYLVGLAAENIKSKGLRI